MKRLSMILMFCATMGCAALYKDVKSVDTIAHELCVASLAAQADDPAIKALVGNNTLDTVCSWERVLGPFLQSAKDAQRQGLRKLGAAVPPEGN